MTATEAIKQRLKDIHMTQAELAAKIGTTKQNLNNKLSRDNFSSRELAEICKAMGLILAFVETEPGPYTIDYTERDS
ncbi:MAG: helix-turn-helix domain-containing protein [Clostridiales bacterium]|nr:helix-turn-helix domain-containing protein [Clostridiales bacterium]